MPIDTAVLAASIQRLDLAVRAPDAFEQAEPGELLHRAIDAADRLFGLSGVGLMFVDENQALRYVAATDEAIRALEVAQEETGEGPCFDALVLGRVVTASNLSADERYPVVGPKVAGHGVRAVLGVPVQLGGASVGTLNVYLDRDHEWEPAEVDALRALTRTRTRAFAATARAATSASSPIPALLR